MQKQSYSGTSLVVKWLRICLLHQFSDTFPDSGLIPGQGTKLLPVAQWLKNLPVIQETQVQSLGQGGFLEEEVAILSSVLAWRILWIEKPGGLKYMGFQSHTRLSD